MEKKGIRGGISGLIEDDLRSDSLASAGIFLVATQPMPTPINKTAPANPKNPKTLENLRMLSSFEFAYHMIKPSPAQIEAHRVCNKCRAPELIARECRFL